jgi:hypothetical protein
MELVVRATHATTADATLDPTATNAVVNTLRAEPKR